MTPPAATPIPTSSAAPGRKKTYDDYCALPDDERYELLDGELWPMTGPLLRHQRALLRLITAVRSFLESHGLGEAIIAPFDVILTRHDVLQPDFLVVRKERAEVLAQRGCEGPPDLVCEILSSDVRRDREVKRAIYARVGVEEYWIVDLDARRVEVYREPGRGYIEVASLAPGDTLTSPVLPGFSFEVSALFTD